MRAENTVFPDERFYSQLCQSFISQFDSSNCKVFLAALERWAHVLRRLKTNFPLHATRLVLEDIRESFRERYHDREAYPAGHKEFFAVKEYDIWASQQD